MEDDRQDYGKPKLLKNRERDSKNDHKLPEDLGWRVIVVCECQCATKQKPKDVLSKLDKRL